MIEQAEYLEWLVKMRSENQDSCLRLYRLLAQNEGRIKIWNEKKHMLTAQRLAGAAFSLWRAVFLGDKTGDSETVVQHAIDFLEKLILENAITFQTDKTYNEWSFNYYADNARYRLLEVYDQWEQLLGTWVSKKRGIRERWEYAHERLNHAIDTFEEHMKDKEPNFGEEMRRLLNKSSVGRYHPKDQE